MARALFFLLAFVAPLSKAGCAEGMFDLSSIDRGDICMDIAHRWPWRDGIGEGATPQNMLDEYGVVRYCNHNFWRFWHAAQMTCWREGKRLCTLPDWQAGYNSDVNEILRDSWSSARYGYVGTTQNANRKFDGTCSQSERVAGQIVNDLDECKVYGHMVSDEEAYRYKKGWHVAFNETSGECRVYGSSCIQNATNTGFVTYTLNNNCYITNNCCNANVQAHGMDGCWSDRFFKCCSDVCTLGMTRNLTAGIGAGHCTVECPMGTKGVLRPNIASIEYDGGGEPTCELCPRGRFANASRSTECYQCPYGTYSDQGASECSACPAGRWGNSNGMSSCTACSAGKYSVTEGSTNYDVCLACPAGKYSPAASTVCIDCPVGRYAVASSQGQAECTICGPGKFGKASGELEVVACQACEAGKSSTGGDQSACHECPPGYVSDGFRSEADPGVCAACAPMKFEENNICKDCPAGKFSLEGSDACSDCFVPGCAAAVDECTNADDGSCSSCEAGFYRTAVGDLSKCEACPYGKTSTEGQTTCTNFDVPAVWLQFTQSDTSNRGSAYSPSGAYGVEVDTSDDGARLLGASISIDNGVVMNKQCYYCGDRPGNDFVLLGFGECKNADGSSPIGTSEGTMTFDACLASAEAKPAVVGIECSGGFPGACVCKHFTETVIEATDAGADFVCMVRSSGAIDSSCCVDELTALSEALSADDDQEEMCRTATEYRECLGSEDCLNAAQANEVYCQAMQICQPAPACGEVTWQLGGSYTDYSVGCMSGCDGDSFVDLTLEECQDACLDTTGCRSIDFFENQPSGEITCVLSNCISPNPGVDVAATDCRYYEWSYQDTSEGNYSVAFWSKVTGTDGDRFLLNLHGLSLYIQDGGLDVYIQDTVGEETFGTLSDGIWFHTVMTYASGADDATVQIYVDGTLAVTRTTPKRPLETLSIGGCDNMDFFVEYEGTILAEGHAESAEACMVLCAEDEDCEFWTYSYASQICKGGKDKTGEVPSVAMGVSANYCTLDANMQDLRVYESVLSLSDIAALGAQQAPVPTLCEEGLFWDNANNKCSVCRTTCGDGKYITSECTRFNDIACEPCLTSCDDGQLRTNTCDGRQNNYCAADANQLCEFDRALCAATLGTGLIQPAHSD